MFFFQEKVCARKEQQKKHGVFFDDEYDYMQHLQDLDELSHVEPIQSFRIEKAPSKKEKVILYFAFFNLFIIQSNLLCFFYSKSTKILSIYMFCNVSLSYTETWLGEGGDENVRTGDRRL